MAARAGSGWSAPGTAARIRELWWSARPWLRAVAAAVLDALQVLRLWVPGLWPPRCVPPGGGAAPGRAGCGRCAGGVLPRP